MGIWIPDPELEDGETVAESLLANRTQGPRAVGGRLFVTDRALHFVASRFDRLLGGRDVTIPREGIEQVSVADRSLEGGPFTGGARRRLAVTAAGSEERFVVNRVDEVRDRLDRWAAGA